MLINVSNVKIIIITKEYLVKQNYSVMAQIKFIYSTCRDFENN